MYALVVLYRALVEEQLKLDVLLAKLSSVYCVFCALINIRNKDLRSNVSLHFNFVVHINYLIICTAFPYQV